MECIPVTLLAQTGGTTVTTAVLEKNRRTVWIRNEFGEMKRHTFQTRDAAIAAYNYFSQTDNYFAYGD